MNKKRYKELCSKGQTNVFDIGYRYLGMGHIEMLLVIYIIIYYFIEEMVDQVVLNLNIIIINY